MPTAPEPFEWAAGFSEAPDLETAVQEVAAQVRDGLHEGSADLLVLFASPEFTEDFDEIPRAVQRALPATVLLGTTGAGVIGAGREAEHRPALAIMAGRLPGVHVAPFHITAEQATELDISPTAWAEFLGVPADTPVHFLLFVHPFTLQAEELVTALDQAFPKGHRLGGLSSGGDYPASMTLFLGDRSYPQGAVGVAFWGNLEVDVIVAQGCRPVGPNLKVTKAAGPDIFELEGEPALSKVREVLEGLSPADRQLAHHALFVGVAMEAHEVEGERAYDGGYLIRNILGADPQTNLLRVGHNFHQGQTVRLQLRDAHTAREELVHLLKAYPSPSGSGGDVGAFLFSCTGRGINLYGVEGHDTALLQEAMGPIPMGGFFCNGEIGPVGEVTYVHGYTSSIGVLRPRPP